MLHTFPLPPCRNAVATSSIEDPRLKCCLQPRKAHGSLQASFNVDSCALQHYMITRKLSEN